jgi:hypothetical protein
MRAGDHQRKTNDMVIYLKTPLLAIVLILSGCTPLLQSTHYVQFTDESLLVVNSTLENRLCTIFLKNGNQLSARSVIVRKDSTIWLDSTHAPAKSITNQEIDKILTIDYAKGGVDGLTIGAGVGLTIFVVAVLANHIFDEDGSAASGYWFLYAGIAAVPIGFAVGANIGYQDHYFYVDSMFVRNALTGSK